MRTIPASARNASIVRLVAWAWLLGCVGLAIYVARVDVRDQLPTSFGETRLVAHRTERTPQATTRPIEQIRLGDRVIARNPQIGEQEREQWPDPDPSQLRHLEMTMDLPPDEVLRIELLRPRQWVEAVGAAPGKSIWLDLAEMGAEGFARVVSVGPCPELESGAGQLVTATFAHPPSTAVLDVWFAGLTEPVGVTDNHLFWSADRGEFLAIGQMEIGERVQTYAGDTKRIAQKLPRPGPQTVYNLEVYGEHVYFVSQAGILAHNAYVKNTGGVDRGETYYRTMSKGDYDELKRTGRLRATSETFISPTKSFSEDYQGVLVEFKVRSGTTNALKSIGVRDTSRIARKHVGDLEKVSKGWTARNAFFKGEGTQINIGLGRGKALEAFNESIVDFKAIRE